MSIFKKKERAFELTGCLDIKVGKLTISIATMDGKNQAIVLSESGDNISEKHDIKDFMDIVHIMWNLERISDEG